MRGEGSPPRARRSCPEKESGGRPAGPRERGGAGLPRAPCRRGSPLPLQRHSPHSRSGPLSARGFSRRHRVPLSGPNQCRAAWVPRPSPPARLPGPRPAPDIGQGVPPADTARFRERPVPPAEPRAVAAQVCAPAVEDSGGGVGVGWSPRPEGGEKRRAHLTMGPERPSRAAQAAGFM